MSSVTNYRLLNISQKDVAAGIAKLTFFQQLPPPVCHALVQRLVLRQFSESELVCATGEPVTSLMVVLRGAVAMFDQYDNFITSLSIGDALGGKGFLCNGVYNTTGLAVDSGVILTMLSYSDYMDVLTRMSYAAHTFDTEGMTRLLRQDGNTKLSNSMRRTLFPLFVSPLFVLLPPAAKDKMINKLQVRTVQHGEVVYSQQDTARDVFIVIDGSLSVHAQPQTLSPKRRASLVDMTTVMFSSDGKTPLAPALRPFGPLERVLSPGDAFGYSKEWNYTPVETVVDKVQRAAQTKNMSTNHNIGNLAHRLMASGKMTTNHGRRKQSVLARQDCVLAHMKLTDFIQVLTHVGVEDQAMASLTSSKFTCALDKHKEDRTKADTDVIKRQIHRLGFFRYLQNDFMTALALSLTRKDAEYGEVILTQGDGAGADDSIAAAEKGISSNTAQEYLKKKNEIAKHEHLGLYIILSGSVAVMQTKEALAVPTQQKTPESKSQSDLTFLTTEDDDIKADKKQPVDPAHAKPSVRSPHAHLGQCLNILTPGDTFGGDFLLFGHPSAYSFVARQPCTFAFLAYADHKASAAEFHVQTFHGKLDLSLVEDCVDILATEAADDRKKQEGEQKDGVREAMQSFSIYDEDDDETQKKRDLSPEEAYQALCLQLKQLLFFNDRFKHDALRRFVYSNIRYVKIPPRRLVYRARFDADFESTTQSDPFVTEEGIYVIIKGSVAMHKRDSVTSMGIAAWKNRARNAIKKRREYALATDLIEASKLGMSQTLSLETTKAPGVEERMKEARAEVKAAQDRKVQQDKNLTKVLSNWRRASMEAKKDDLMDFKLSQKETDLSAESPDEDDLRIKVLYGSTHSILSIGNQFGLEGSQHKEQQSMSSNLQSKPVAYFTKETSHFLFIPKDVYFRTVQTRKENRDLEVIVPALVKTEALLFPPLAQAKQALAAQEAAVKKKAHSPRKHNDEVQAAADLTSQYVYLRDLAKYIEVRVCPRNAAILTQGELANNVAILVEGEAKMVSTINLKLVANPQDMKASFNIEPQTRHAQRIITIYSQGKTDVQGTVFAHSPKKSQKASKRKNTKAAASQNMSGLAKAKASKVGLLKAITGRDETGLHTIELARVGPGSIFGGRTDHEMHEFEQLAKWGYFELLQMSPLQHERHRHDKHHVQVTPLMAATVNTLTTSLQKKTFDPLPLTYSVVALKPSTVFLIPKSAMFSLLPPLPLYQLCDTEALRRKRHQEKIIQFLKVRKLIPEDASVVKEVKISDLLKKRVESMSGNVLKTHKTLDIIRNQNPGLSRTMPAMNENAHLTAGINRHIPLNREEADYKMNLSEFNVELQRLLSLADNFTASHAVHAAVTDAPVDLKTAFAMQKHQEKVDAMRTQTSLGRDRKASRVRDAEKKLTHQIEESKTVLPSHSRNPSQSISVSNFWFNRTVEYAKVDAEHDMISRNQTLSNHSPTLLRNQHVRQRRRSSLAPFSDDDDDDDILPVVESREGLTSADLRPLQGGHARSVLSTASSNNSVELQLEQLMRQNDYFRANIETRQEKSSKKDIRTFEESMNRLAILTNIGRQDFPQAYSYDFSSAAQAGKLQSQDNSVIFELNRPHSKKSNITGYELGLTAHEVKAQIAARDRRNKKNKRWVPLLESLNGAKQQQKQMLLNRSRSLPSVRMNAAARDHKKVKQNKAYLSNKDLLNRVRGREKNVDELVARLTERREELTRASHNTAKQLSLDLSPAKRKFMEGKRAWLRERERERKWQEFQDQGLDEVDLAIGW